MTNILFFDAVARDEDSDSSSTCSEISYVPPQSQRVTEALYSAIGRACLACVGGDYDGNCSIREPLSSSVNSPPMSEGEVLQLPKLGIFRCKQLVAATNVFNRSHALGGGVFKVWINETTLTATECGEGTAVAVKSFGHKSPNEVTKWLEEIRYWGQFCHPNLLRTIGYSTEDQECLLVSEFLPQGSLEDHLFKGDSDFPLLSWSRRMKIALGAAKCLAFLHKNGAIHGNFKPSNILLDSDYNPKLSIGVVKEIPYYVESIFGLKTSTFNFVNEYTLPECILTGFPTCEGDVYSFGLVLLEMLIGRKVVQSELKLASTHKRVVTAYLDKVVRSELKRARAYEGEDKLTAYLNISCHESHYDLREAKRVLQLAFMCLSCYSSMETVVLVQVLDKVYERSL